MGKIAQNFLEKKLKRESGGSELRGMLHVP